MESTSPTSPARSKREMTRLYKETLRPAGVYAIRNTANGRVFVGASLDLEGALNRQRFELRMRGHRDAALQRDWDQFGAEAFRFDVLHTLKKRDDPAHDYAAELADLLALWREELQA
jgi:hypothetical protein